MWFKSTLALIFFLVSISVYAAPNYKFTLSAGLSLQNTDNILLTPDNTISDNIVHTLVHADYLKKSPVLDTHLILNADNQNYQTHNTFDQTTISSVFTATSTISKRRIFWDLLNRFDRVQINQTLANLPNNQENTNYFTTGPRLALFTNNKHSLNIGAQYERFYTETSDLDYHGGLFALSYNRNITRLFSIGLTGKYGTRTYTEQTQNSDYNRTDVIVNFTKKQKVSEIKLELGETTVNPVVGDSSKNSIFGFQYYYNHKDIEKLDISFRRELTDFSTAFSTSTIGEPTYASASRVNFLLKQGQLNFTRNFGLSSVRYSYLYQGNDYNDNVLDLLTKSNTLALQHRLTPTLSFNIDGTYREQNFSGIDRRDIARVYSMSLRKTYFNSYDVTFNVQYTNNSSTDSSYVYTERRVSLGGNYYFR